MAIELIPCIVAAFRDRVCFCSIWTISQCLNRICSSNQRQTTSPTPLYLYLKFVPLACREGSPGRRRVARRVTFLCKVATCVCRLAESTEQ
ncbi:hypothetical protein HanIR_Chr15g0733611 [Helianthus annuus]|nr:hypothetical protein HanIR_Chr15g0733611 [Helianthus annuus]